MSTKNSTQFIKIILLWMFSISFIFIAVFAPELDFCPKVFDGDGLRQRYVFLLGFFLFTFNIFYFYSYITKLISFKQTQDSHKKIVLLISKKWINPMLSLLSFVIILIVFELFIMLWFGNYDVKNNLLQTRNLFKYIYPTQYDSTLGWIPKVGSHKAWDSTIALLQF